MNNTLTAKEWLEKEELYSCTREYRNKIELAAEEVDLFIYMEKYANYKNRILEDRIKEFRKELEYRASLLDSTGSQFNKYLKKYDKHFNIK